MFRGRYQHALDPKGRVSIPAKYRDLLAQYEGATLVLVPNEHALEVHPLEEWERLEARINEKSMFDAELRKIGRLYISRAKEVELDGAGRILVPPDTRQQGGLGREVTLVGLGRNFFEIWDRGRFEEYERTNGDGLPAGFDKLAQLGV
ncbi:MAG: division/cell wall cluster transcriptional repressor MraZ [Candidatus Rokubacteria bacterium]|nr:division/cell wall cluster transcriptional repressor MraZ [Candidatus Rokubacteria bacterium]